MSLSNLISYSEAEYRALGISSFSTQPSRSSSGSPDPRASIQLGGWVGTNLLAFTITNAANSSSGLGIDDTTANMLDLNIFSDNDPSAEVTYWTIDMGPGASGSSWSISYKVEANSVDTGKWVFTKGKSDEDKY